MLKEVTMANNLNYYLNISLRELTKIMKHQPDSRLRYDPETPVYIMGIHYIMMLGYSKWHCTEANNGSALRHNPL
jgi:hypothetical protein